ncbi:putative monocarboxylate transporter [Coniella lustricola]|uniref:Putative monocarboxylate transporter n=1 Tax=Coniella lustricola TaxID=2025994 RepID=A0A2T3ADT8_9PEZI|nr:putative monocarboxylate transporter [Coniella lustricola]
MTTIAGKRESYDETTSGADSVLAAENPEPTGNWSSQDAEKAAPPAAAWGSDAPDGGWTAWLVILGVWCTSFCSFGWLNSVGTFQEYYQGHLLSEYSASTVSWIPSLQIFFLMGMGPFVGLIYDHHGPRMLLFFGTILHVLGIMMASLATEYYQILLAQGVCSAVGCACLFQPSVTCAAGWFNKKRGIAFGVMFTGSSVGGIIFPILVSRLITEIGFPWAMRTCGFLVLFLLIIANLTVKALHQPKPHPVTAAQLAKPLKEVDFLLIMLGFFLFAYGFFVPINYLPSQALSAGMSASLSQYLLSILNAGSLFGRLLAGIYSDKFGKYNIYIVVCFLSGIWVLGLWVPAKTDGALIAFAVLFGFFSGAYVSLITPLVMAISPFNELGFRVGIVMLTCAVAGLTANPINGAILDGAGGWMGVKIWSGVFCVVGTVSTLVVRGRRAGWKLTTIF